MQTNIGEQISYKFSGVNRELIFVSWNEIVEKNSKLQARSYSQHYSFRIFRQMRRTHSCVELTKPLNNLFFSCTETLKLGRFGRKNLTAKLMKYGVIYFNKSVAALEKLNWSINGIRTLCNEFYTIALRDKKQARLLHHLTNRGNFHRRRTKEIHFGLALKFINIHKPSFYKSNPQYLILSLHRINDDCGNQMQSSIA